MPNKQILNKKEILRAASFVLEKQVDCISELSDNQLVFFSSFSSIELNRCFAIQDVLSGKSYDQASIRYGISKSRLHEMVNAG